MLLWRMHHIAATSSQSRVGVTRRATYPHVAPVPTLLFILMSQLADAGLGPRHSLGQCGLATTLPPGSDPPPASGPTEGSSQEGRGSPGDVASATSSGVAASCASQFNCHSASYTMLSYTAPELRQRHLYDPPMNVRELQAADGESGMGRMAVCGVVRCGEAVRRCYRTALRGRPCS